MTLGGLSSSVDKRTKHKLDKMKMKFEMSSTSIFGKPNVLIRNSHINIMSSDGS